MTGLKKWVHSAAISRARRDEMVDRDVQQTGPEKTRRMDLGIAALHAAALPGACFSYDDIARWAGCTESAIWLIERRAMRKVRAALAMRGYRLDEELERRAA